MSNETTTVTVGETEVQVTETDDGFEVTEVEEEDDFIEYVNTIDIASCNDVDNSEDVPASSYADAVVSYESHFSQSEMQKLIDDDGVELGRVEANDDRVYLDLFDQR